MNEYAFDVTLLASIRIPAESTAAALQKLETLLDCASANFGELDGEPVVGEASLHGKPTLVEIRHPVYAAPF